MDAVLLRECDDAFAGHMPLDRLVDLGMRQKGLSRPDFSDHDAVRPGSAGLATVTTRRTTASPRGTPRK